MPRPEHHIIQFTIDGREVRAIEGSMLVDAAKHGDVEIPYFCYEPKLGNPVGACRMCLVEIEGIPKLQTSCSTPVKDGMVVNTQTERVRHAQNGVVEFLLVNHPLDCPVCDKGGECPLQDISFGWGLGRSRVIEPKRHFVKPLALSPLVAIDRERCILCYRCVRFSQEVSEDYQLVFADRGADTFVATHDGHPYVAPFSGNIVELCPVGALTSQPYRFRARPWEIEGAGSICTLCPSQCNVELTVRDEKVLRVLSREHDEVDDGWLCDKGRFAYQSIHADERVTAPLVREGGELREAGWERALEVAAGLAEHKGRAGALAGGQATNEEGFLLARLMREALACADIDSRAGGPMALGLTQALADPKLQAAVPDLEFAHTVLVLGCEPLDDAPILDLWIRKGVRRRGVKLAVATARPSALDASAKLVVRYPPGGEHAFLVALAAALAGDEQAAGDESNNGARALASLLTTGGEDVVIVWGERIGPAAAQMPAIAEHLRLAEREGAGLLEVPAGANGRGLREAGVLPGAGPGYAELGHDAPIGRDAAQIAAAAAAGELTALYLLETDPVRDRADRHLWNSALARASLVVAHASVLTDGIREHASVVFPAESYAEKEGTVVHPDGRVQRLRAAIGHPDQVRAGWSVLAELGRRAGHELEVPTSAAAFAQLVEAVPFYAGLTLDQLGGRGVRWPARELSSRSFPAPSATPAAEPGWVQAGAPRPEPSEAAGPKRPENGMLRLGTYRSIWAAPEVELSPALHFTIAHQQVELSPADARRLGIASGVAVEIAQNGRSLQGIAAIRTGVPDGTAFLAEGIAADSANVLTEQLVEVRKA
ncbi:MAG: NADH dehydrogenase (quinone) subunit G [Solirubrobacterales bacterium]|nr:MAG: NADH dehydrogenase (quinone) subunit G [Solirubrobacterales bacterium]